MDCRDRGFGGRRGLELGRSAATTGSPRLTRASPCLGAVRPHARRRGVVASAPRRAPRCARARRRRQARYRGEGAANLASSMPSPRKTSSLPPSPRGRKRRGGSFRCRWPPTARLARSTPPSRRRLPASSPAPAARLRRRRRLPPSAHRRAPPPRRVRRRAPPLPRAPRRTAIAALRHIARAGRPLPLSAPQSCRRPRSPSSAAARSAPASPPPPSSPAGRVILIESRRRSPGRRLRDDPGQPGTAPEAPGLVDAHRHVSILADLAGATDYAALAEADLVIEAVSEDFASKSEVFAALDRATRPEAILAEHHLPSRPEPHRRIRRRPRPRRRPALLRARRRDEARRGRPPRRRPSRGFPDCRGVRPRHWQGPGRAASAAASSATAS